MKKFNLLILLGVFIFVGCSDNELDNNFYHENPDFEEVVDTEKHLVEFAKVLSKAVHERKDVREFLKNEALKQFDCNYNVLYYLVSDELIGDESFRDILISYSSEEVIDQVERNVPLLNILIPELHFFDVFPEELDVDDDEIPVAVPIETKTILYFNGEEELSLDNREIPGFHVFVVNENRQVIIPQNNLKSGAAKTIEFKSPNFDGSKVISNNSILKSTTASEEVLGSKAIKSWQYFYANDGSVNQKAFQRDYIYYGITPNQRSGSFNHSIDEYISYIEVDPVLYYEIADDKRGNDGDPYVENPTVSQEKNPMTADEIYKKMWTQGAFNFRFEIIKSNSSTPIRKHVTIKPKDLWDFDITYTRRHSTWFRRSKHTYTIDLSKMKPTKVFLRNLENPQEVAMGKWNIQEESLKRHIMVYEEDLTAETKLTKEIESIHVHKANFKGNVKVNIGIAETGWEAGYNYENTTREKQTVEVKYQTGDDHLGDFELYFYDPVITDRIASNLYEIKTYSSGGFKFGVTVK